MTNRTDAIEAFYAAMPDRSAYCPEDDEPEVIDERVQSLRNVLGFLEGLDRIEFAALALWAADQAGCRVEVKPGRHMDYGDIGIAHDVADEVIRGEATR